MKTRHFIEKHIVLEIHFVDGTCLKEVYFKKHEAYDMYDYYSSQSNVAKVVLNNFRNDIYETTKF